MIPRASATWRFSFTLLGETGHTRGAIPTYDLQSALVLAVGLCAASSACSVEAPLGSDLSGSYRVVVDTPALLRDKLDLLFVIDDSENMAERQAELADSFQRVFEHLSFGRGLPDLHIGVVSTDLGVGPFGDVVPGCSATGQSGALTVSGCAIDGEPYMTVERDVDGGLLQNFEGDLSETFSCLAQLGEQGCDYEQPLEAMRTSIDGSHAESNGFVRPDAVLGVILLTDEDDCSAYDPALFDPNNPRFRGDDPDFRCFQSGVICDGDDVYTPGTRDGCRPRESSDYIVDVGSYTSFLREIKPQTRDLVVNGIFGDPGNVGVRVGDDGLDAELLPSCQDSMGAAALPGIRLGAFVDDFSELGEQSSLCDAGPAAGLESMVRDLRKSMGTTCLEGNIADVDPDRAGRQVDCIVYEERASDDSTRIEVPECDRPGNFEGSSVTPCYSIQTGGEACGDFRTQLALQVHGRKTPPAAGDRLVAECRVMAP